MDVILSEGVYANWLRVSTTRSRGLLALFYSDKLVATLKA